jgi:hypothetical protein
MPDHRKIKTTFPDGRPQALLVDPGLTDAEWVREAVGRLCGDAHNRNSDGPEREKRPLFLKRQTVDHSFHRAYL